MLLLPFVTDQEAIERGLSIRRRALRELAQRLEKLEGPFENLEAGPYPSEGFSSAEITSITEAILDRFDGLEAKLYRLDLRSDEQGGLDADILLYRQALGQVRETVRMTVPRDATVAVANQGDEALLDLFGRDVLPFPTVDESKETAEPLGPGGAIVQLEDARTRGASFFLLPRPSFSWFSESTEFEEYLSRRYPLIARHENCILYSLGTDVQRRPYRIRRDLRVPKVETVSVIMPIYNGIQPGAGDRWLHETIQSVISEHSDVPVELVIVDDGSVDGTGLVLADYDNDAKVNAVTLQKWRGFGSAMNIGVEAANGTIIGRISVGDRFLRGKLRMQLAALQERRLDVVGSGARITDPAGRRVGERDVPQSDSEIRNALPSGVPIVFSSMLMRRNVWAQVGGYSTDPVHRLAEDYEFLVRAVAHPAGFRFGNLPAPLCEHRNYEGRVPNSPLTRERHEAALRRVRDDHSLSAEGAAK